MCTADQTFVLFAKDLTISTSHQDAALYESRAFATSIRRHLRKEQIAHLRSQNIPLRYLDHYWVTVVTDEVAFRNREDTW
jgi:hypothetical protein